MGTHKSIPVSGYSFKYITPNCSFQTDRLQGRWKTTQRQGICFSCRTLISEQLSAVEACETLFFHQQPSRHFDCDSIRASNGVFSQRSEDNPVIFVLLATLGLVKRKGKERALCAVLLDIVLRVELYCLPPRWSYCAVQTGGLAATAWLSQILYHVGVGTASLTATPMLKALLRPFFNFTTKPAMFLSSPQPGNQRTIIHLEGEDTVWFDLNHGEEGITSLHVMGTHYEKIRSRIRSKYSNTISSLFEGCRQSLKYSTIKSQAVL